MTLRVLNVVANRAYGGAERHVADLCSELVRRGRKVACLFPATAAELRDRLGPAVEAYEAASLLSPPRFRRCLGQAIRSFGPDVVHLHGPRASILGRLAVTVLPRRARPAVVSTAHGWVPRRLAFRAGFEAAYLLTTSLDDATIAVCADTARRFGRWSASVRVVLNGIAVAGELPPYTASPETGTVRLGFVGRLTQEKNFTLALEAFTEILARVGVRLPAPELHVYGDGPLLPAARAEVARRRLGGVFFHGWVDPGEIPAVMTAFTALLLTSREEGLPYVLLEAMAAGCPVVATAVGGIPDLVEHGRTGWLARPGDPVGLAGAVLALVDDPRLAAAVRLAARRKVSALSVEDMVDEVERVYEAALARRRSR